MTSRPANPLVFLDHLGDDYRSLVLAGLEHVGFFRDVPAGGTVFLKPNLTFPVYRPGVMTSFECLKAVVEALRERGFRVIIGEADSGGYNRFSMDEVFAKTGITELARATGAEVVNLSYTESESIPVCGGWRTLAVPLPKLLLHKVDAFVTLPVPKIHMNTQVSLALKNQWGCIQEPAERLKLHPFFPATIYEVCRRLPRAYAVVDGRFGLNGTGPMQGNPVALNWLLVANDLVAADRVCCRLMQVDEARLRYLRHFRRAGWWTDYHAIQVSQPLEPFLKEKFYLQRAWTDYPGLLCFNNSFLAWLGYRSPLAGFAHWLLYKFRKPFYDYDAEAEKVKGHSGRRGAKDGVSD